MVRLCKWIGLWLMGVLALGSSAGRAEIRETGVWWLPRNVSNFGHEIDFIFYVILWLTGITAVLVFGAMIYFIVKYRHRAGVGAIHSHGNNTLEIVWTTIPVFIFLALAIYGNEMWGKMRMENPPTDALQLAIVGEQFGWNLRYPGPDGKLAKMDSHKISKENPFGIDPADPDGQDDFTTYNDMVIPVGKAVRLHLGSKDVIHSFYVPEFRLYQDMVPGRVYDFVWFKTDATGHFQLACNQLCGQGHYKMFGKLGVVPQEEYDSWAKGKAPAPATASTAPAPQNVSVANR